MGRCLWLYSSWWLAVGLGGAAVIGRLGPFEGAQAWAEPPGLPSPGVESPHATANGGNAPIP